MTYDSRAEWTKNILGQSSLAYPAEYVIRILKGSYPNLNLDKNYRGKKICDIGCGDGRNFIVMKECGFDLYGTEISQEIVDQVHSNLERIGITKTDVRVGSNDKIPFPDGFFDYLLSWNACYYMGQFTDFQSYVKEFSRVLKPNGLLIMSIPKKSCFIYHDCEKIGDGCIIVRNDPFNVRNGEVLRMFDCEEDIVRSFSPFFTNYIFGSDHDNCFGYDYHWHLVVCHKK